MSTYMSQEVLTGLHSAETKRIRAQSRMRVRAGEQVFPILKFSEESFSLSAQEAPHLRGYVDILDGVRLKYRALIIASEQENDEMVFEFKLSTTVANGPALDFEKDEAAPVALLPSI